MGPQCWAGPALAQGCVWRGHQLRSGTLAAILAHPPSLHFSAHRLGAVKHKHWSAKGWWAPAPTEDTWVVRAGPLQVRPLPESPGQWTLPCLPVQGEDLTSSEGPSLCPGGRCVPSLPEGPLLLPQLGAPCQLLSPGCSPPARSPC